MLSKYPITIVLIYWREGANFLPLLYLAKSRLCWESKNPSEKNPLYSTMQFASPQIVNLLIAFVQNDEPTWRGYFYTVLICGATFMCTIFNSQCFYQGALHLTMKYLAILLVEGLRFPKYIPSLFKVLDMEFFKFEKKPCCNDG